MDRYDLDVFFQFQEYHLYLIYIGLIVLVAGVLPRILEQRTITAPIIYLVVGVLIFSLPLGERIGHLAEDSYWPKRLMELGVIISLTGVGLKINRPFSWRTWKVSSRLLLVTMPLSMLFFFLLGYYGMGLLSVSAVLLAVVITPTDPVLAADIQTSSPSGEDVSLTRLSLTTEAGLNDGLAFPFTHFAIALAVWGTWGGWWQQWVLMDVLYRIGAGVLLGALIGWLLGKLLFSVPVAKNHLSKISTGMLALSLTFLPYGLAELISAYGFIAVFAAACVFRQLEAGHRYMELLHSFSEEMERIIIAIMFVFLGTYLVNDFSIDFQWYMIPAALAAIFLIRPLAGMAGLLGLSIPVRKKWVISFFGIRGMGSLFYLFYAFYETDYAEGKEILALTVLIIILSVFVHGLLAHRALSWAKVNK